MKDEAVTVAAMATLKAHLIETPRMRLISITPGAGLEFLGRWWA
jgi:hypothetical protein